MTASAGTAMIPHAIPNLCGNEGAYLQQCVETNFVSSVGPFVTRFEEMVAAAAGAAQAVATSSGTTGLHAALVTVGVGPGDLVIMPSLTFVATANAVSHCGATPWLFDVEPANWTLSATQLAHVLEHETRRDGGVPRHVATGARVAAVMPVFTLGLPPEMDAIVKVADAHGLPVVVDAAAALGATWNGKPVAASGGALYVFSFNGNKTVTAGGGGAIAGSDAGLLQLARHLTTTARVGDDYDHDRVGFNYRMTNLQAAVGCAQMEKLDDLVARKRAIHELYKAAFFGCSGLKVLPEARWGSGACWLSGIVLDDGLAAHNAELRHRLADAGVDARPFWKPMHLLAPYREVPRTGMPVSNRLWQRVVTLPSSTGTPDDDLRRVVDAVLAAARNLGQ